MLFAKLFLLCSLTIMIVDNNYIIYIHVTIQYTYTLVDLVSPNFSDICKPWYYYHNTMHCITVIKSFIFNLDIHQSTRCADTKLYIHCTTVVIKIQNIHIVTPKKTADMQLKGYDISRVRIAIRPYLIGSLIIKATSYIKSVC